MPGKIASKCEQVNMDFCLGIPALLAGYHALSHSKENELNIWKLPNIPKFFENDWVHFGAVFAILFLIVLLIEVIASTITTLIKKH